jgi:hypothetical protein
MQGDVTVWTPHPYPGKIHTYHLPRGARLCDKRGDVSAARADMCLTKILAEAEAKVRRCSRAVEAPPGVT